MSHVPLKGMKFMSKSKFECVVVNYDDTSGKYIYKSPIGTYGYESYEWIIEHKSVDKK